MEIPVEKQQSVKAISGSGSVKVQPNPDFDDYLAYYIRIILGTPNESAWRKTLSITYLVCGFYCALGG